tara:strand:+ start:375 stop:968 length:594 start_codon:yes stop_codon:yes gene_type:complete
MPQTYSRKRPAPPPTPEVSKFFNGLRISWEPSYVEDSAWERRLKREGRWVRAPTDKYHWVGNEYGDDFTVAQYECFLNRCPVDDVEVHGPETYDESEASVQRHNDSYRPLDGVERTRIAYKAPHIELEGPTGVKTYFASNGASFTVRELFEVLADHVRDAMRAQVAAGDLNLRTYPFHMFLGLERNDDDAYDVKWDD